MASEAGRYDAVLKKARRWLAKTNDFVTNAANLSALLFESYNSSALTSTNGDISNGLPPVNWVGFYLLRPWTLDRQGIDDNEEEGCDEAKSANTPAEADVKEKNAQLGPKLLVLGPFQGKAAVPLIPVGRGVCGQCVAAGGPIVVPDVHAHPDHIVCDEASASEIVIPVFAKKTFNGLDDNSTNSSDGASEPAVCIGVLDIDSRVTGFFTEADVAPLQELVAMLVASASTQRRATPTAPVAAGDHMSSSVSDFVTNPILLFMSTYKSLVEVTGPVCHG